MLSNRSLKRRVLIALLTLSGVFPIIVATLVASAPRPAEASSSTVVISQVYGGGGNSGATYKNDFVELYNLSGAPVSVAGWSVQYASSGGTTWQRTNIAGTIQPGHYYLIKEAAGTGGTLPLPTAEMTGTIAMSATAGKIALVNNQTTLSGACPTGATIVDFLGFGAANCSETSPTAQLSNTTAAIRKGAGSIDTDNNSADFAVGFPTPRNSANSLGAVALATSPTIAPGFTTLLSVAVSPAAQPDSTGITASCNLTSIGGSATQALFDDGSHGDLVAGDNTFSFSTTATSPATYNLPCTYSDAQGRTGASTIVLTVQDIISIGMANGAVTEADATRHRSPYAPASGNAAGQTVVVQGIIYEKTLQAITASADSFKGFFVQNTSATGDSDTNTSDGLFVFMNTDGRLAGPNGAYTPSVGDEVVLAGAISEFFNMTELNSPTLVAVVRSGVDLDAEIPAFEANPPTGLADANRYWERRQGMRAQAPLNSIVLNGRNDFNPPDSEIWLARADSTIAQRHPPYQRRAFRDAHPLDDNFDPNNWDGNGYRILMGGLGLKATVGDKDALLPPARTFDSMTSSPVGGINYSFGKYRIEVITAPTFKHGNDPAGNNPPSAPNRSVQYNVADFNLENLYDYRDNPFSGCDFAGNAGCPQVVPFLAAINPPYDYVPASDAAYQARLTGIAKQIVGALHSPDILMVQEVENQDICMVNAGALVCGATDNADGKPDVLQELALKIASLGGPAYDAAFDRNSSDLRGILPAFLYRTDRVQLPPAAAGDPVLGSSPQIGYAGAPAPYDSDVSNPKSLNAVSQANTTGCETSYVYPRAADVGLFRIYRQNVGKGPFVDLYLVNNHFKSGPDACVAPRQEQAKYSAAIAQAILAANPAARVIVGGDLNVFPRPDDPFAPIGQTGSSDQLKALYDSGLSNLWDVLLAQAPAAAYTYDFQGQAQTLDQMFVSPALFADLQEYRAAHINSDFPADDTSVDVARGTSDHDPNAAIFKFR